MSPISRQARTWPPMLVAAASVVALTAVALTVPSSAQLPAERAAATVGMFSDSAPRTATLDSDRSSVELGIKFRSKVAGRVTGAQVYKIATSKSATPRRASLWNAAGERLASAKIARRAGAGWITVAFDQPVQVVPREKYTVSVFAPRGQYAVTEDVLGARKVRGDLVITGVNNGVYAYSAKSTFPRESHQSSNYWVDVTFAKGKGKKTDPTSGPTASPTKTPTASPTKTPTASPTATPSAPPTGFPNASNTGIPAGTQLTDYTGPMRITTPGTVISGKTIRGNLDILAEGVVVENSMVYGSVHNDTTGTGSSFTIRDSEIDAGGPLGEEALDGTGVFGRQFTALRVNVYGGKRGIGCWELCEVRDSYVHVSRPDPTGVAHQSGIRMGQGSTIVHNTIQCDAPTIPPDAGCSAGLTGYGDFDPVRDNLIQDNLFKESSGGACAYGGSSGGKPFSDDAANIRFINNVFERGESGKCGYWFPVADFSKSAPGNVWQGNTWLGGGAVNP